MRMPAHVWLLVAFITPLVAVAQTPVSPWTLVWQDEFDGSRLDRETWNVITAGNGFGNKELEYYTNRPTNLMVDQGLLTIRAVKETYKGADGITRDYTSARINTKGKFSQRYGRFEARMKLPVGQGIWPAFWLMGDEGGERWPACGEIDIMENIGSAPSTVLGTIHGPGYSGAKGISTRYTSPAAPFSDDFHLYAVEWEPEAIRWYVDSNLYQTLTPASLPTGARWVFDHPFYILLNLAVGGNLPHNPDETTVFPQSLLVDYVRVYQREK